MWCESWNWGSRVRLGALAWAAVLACVHAFSAAPAAAQGRTVATVRVGPAGQPSSDVVFTMEAAEGRTTLIAAGPAVRAEKTVFPDRLVLSLKAGGDEVTIRADVAGRIEITRGETLRTLTSFAVSRADLAAVRAQLAGSDAVAAFRVMAAALEDVGGAAVESIVVSGALVALLDGDTAAPARLARRIVARAAARVRLASGQRTAGECWDIYSREALRIADETEECLKRQWWNPVHTAACGAEFVIRAELNWFWLIACSGGLPGQP